MNQDEDQSITSELLEVQRTLGWMDLVLGSIHDAVYVTDKDSRLVFTNQCFSDLLGTSRVFLLGESRQALFDTQPVAKIPIEFKDDPVDHIMDGVTTEIHEWTNTSGVKHIFRISRQVLKTTDQTVYLAQNITREYELSRMKSNFIDLASHQLRTPMTAVMTYAHLLHDGFAGELTEQQQRLSATILEASERMIKLVNDLLLITRTQNNSVPTLRSPVPIHPVLERIYSEVEPALQKRDQTLQITVTPKTLRIASDRPMLHEILSNLIVNAIQYTPQGGVVAVKAGRTKQGIAIRVIDTGIGIPKEHMPNLYKQFSRADNALLAYPDGTGLGLYMIKLLLEKIGGSISCISQVGKGTTFTVTLPAVTTM